MQERGPEPVAEILSRLFLARGWGSRQSRHQLEQAWQEAVGELAARRTRLGALRRGVLEVLVGDAVLLQEFANFQKQQVLKSLNERLGEGKLRELRFRLGSIDKH